MSRILPVSRNTWARAGWGGVATSPSRYPLHGDCAFCHPQEHPFFTLHKTKKTDIAAFVKEILGEDS